MGKVSLTHRCSYPGVLFLRDRNYLLGGGGGTIFGGRVTIFLAPLWGKPFFKKNHLGEGYELLSIYH